MRRMSENGGKKRRWPKVVGFVVLGLAVLFGGLLLVLRLTSPPPLNTVSDVEPAELPAAWLAPSTTDDALGSASATQTASLAAAGEEPELATPEEAPEPDIRDFATTGSLAFYNDGRLFGEESYSLHIDESGASLRSSGEFRFRAVVATIRIAFEQSLELDEGLVPSAYRASYDAPLGMDREVTVDVSERTAYVGSGSDSATVELSSRTVALGTFATYTLLPFLMTEPKANASDSEADDRQAFDVLILGGPPGSDEGGESLPTMSVLPLGEVRILAREQELLVDGYTVSSTLGESLLLGKGPEFLAYLASGDDGGSFSVLRTDLFPDGLEILGSSAAALPGGLTQARYP